MLDLRSVRLIEVASDDKRGHHVSRSLLVTLARKPSGMSGVDVASAWSQTGQGAPAPPQEQARSPYQGRSGCVSQTSGHCRKAHTTASQILPQALEEGLAYSRGLRPVFDLGQ